MMRVQVKGVSPQRHGNPESSKGKFDRESSFNRHGLNRSYHLRRSSKTPRESTPIRRLAVPMQARSRGGVVSEAGGAPTGRIGSRSETRSMKAGWSSSKSRRRSRKLAQIARENPDRF